MDNTDKTVYFADERIKWFVEDERIRICGRESCPEALKIYDEFVPSAFDADYSRMDAMVLFHHIFMFQWLTPLKLSDVKYVEFTVPSTEGIGSIFLAYGRGKAFFAGKYGFTVTLKPGAARYSDSMMQKYCNIAYTPEDSNENNTICIVNYHAIMKMRYLRKEAALDDSIYTDNFLHDMKSYAEAVLKDKKVLGMLLRGTDYLVNQFGGKYKPVTVDMAIQEAEELLKEYNYDRIFLATEDKDILDAMKENFKDKLITVSQKRYHISDFTDEFKTISQIDRTLYPVKEDYDDFVEDVTVNYLYAMYILSNCDAFVYSCRCSGAAIVTQLGEDKIKRRYVFPTDRASGQFLSSIYGVPFLPIHV